MISELKSFLMKGNVIDLAVALVIGLAFTAIVTALVEGIITPLIAAIVGSPDFAGITWTVNGSDLMIGMFLNAVINFLLVGTVLFFIVKAANRAMEARKEEEVEEVVVEADPEELLLLRQIRDSLATRA